MQQPMQNSKDSSDPKTAMNMTLALLAKAFKVHTIPTNNNQRSSLIPHNSQIAQPDINTSQDLKMQMVNDNVGNLIAQEEEVGIQSTQDEFEFMTAADDHEETQRVQYTKCEECKYDKISYDKAYNDMQQKIEWLQAQLGDLKGKSSDTQCASNTFDMVSLKLKDENVSLESQVLNYAKENAHLKATYNNLQQANFNSSDFSPTRVNNTAKTIRPQPARVHSKSKSSCLSNIIEKLEENHKNSPIPKTQKHKSSECNNIKLAIRNAKSKVVCAMCKQCFVTANHDVCMLNYVNEKNSRADNQCANVSIRGNQKKHKANAKKSKELGSK
ncbi:hypothetical protein Tco_0221339 [Tanacetum coccineum]